MKRWSRCNLPVLEKPLAIVAEIRKDLQYSDRILLSEATEMLCWEVEKRERRVTQLESDLESAIEAHEADLEWQEHCSAYRMLCWADQSPEHYGEAQWAAMDDEHRVALRKKIMATPPDESMSQEVRDLRHMVAMLKEQVVTVSNSVTSHVKDHDDEVEKRLGRLVERVELEREAKQREEGTSATVVVPVQSGVPRGLSDPYVPPQEVRPKFPWGLECKDCRSRVEFYHHQGGFTIRCKSCGISEWYNQAKCECLYKIETPEDDQ